ncbi:IS3 family transposase [Rhodococcoides kyotonense]|uniref:Transposase InsO and inactivated derivatives n=1 Tax=Rhodococcoides kyotonense TaxID=398843 RepID=A0A239I9R8_9NOCA|nr:IS3 family transposase [Rhodococcus kyotonensis]SNS89783.1 Transposase InsO and inactivated derivatives [Rhodococcus kyotonensis]
MKVTAVVSLRAQYRLDVLLDVAGLARSTFFYHQSRLGRPDKHAALKAEITSVFSGSHNRYGHRPVHRTLKNKGWRVAKKTVLKLMRVLGLHCPVRRRRRYVSYQGEVGAVAQNLLDRDFSATQPNQKWVTDVTEFRVGDEKAYLSPVMDLFDRQIIAYSIGISPSLQLTNTSLVDAIATLDDGEAPLVHSDQGFQYQHVTWRALIANCGAVQSMSRKGNCHDNAMIENFFGHLKEEAFHHVRYLNIEALITAVHQYIHWYNNDRISLRLEGLSPVHYRAQTLAA